MRRRARRSVIAVGLAAVALGAAACTAGTPSPLPAATDPLLTVETRGGLCADGPCGTTIVVERDGRIRQAARRPSDLGTVPQVALAALEAAIRQTDFATLRTVPFTGTCPTAYDGQETVFEFGGPGGVERIATCEVEVDFGSPLMRAVATALGPLVSIPTPLPPVSPASH